MEKIEMSLKNYINKPKLDWVKMKIEAFKRLDENNRLRAADAELRELYPRLGEHIYRTVEKLISLFRKKFERGQLGSGFKLKFTYSYFKQHADSRYCIRTFINHFNAIADAYKSIFKVRDRDVLQLTDRDCNCVCIAFSDGIIQYTDQRFNELHKMEAPKVQVVNKINFSPQVFNNPVSNEHQFFERGGGIQKIGDLFGSLLKPR